MNEYPTIKEDLSNSASENLQKLAMLFPTAVNDGELDLDALREELGDFAEVGDEKYELSWAGKQAAKKKAFEPLQGKTLKFLPDASKDLDSTQNLYIEGDNLEALKLLRQNYFGEIKMIYIDPPYNTGKDFVYGDKFTISKEESDREEGATSTLGERLVKNEKSSNRFHARWLSMMYPRLRLARDLLKAEGLIFISIDDNEVTNLRKLCDEVFGEDNFIGSIAVQSNPRGRQSDTFVATVHDSLVVYAKNIGRASAFGKPLSAEQRAEFNLTEEETGEKYRLLGLRQRGAASRREDRPEMYFPIYVNRESLEISLEPVDGWEAVYPRKSDGSDGRWMWGKGKCKDDMHLLVARLITTRNEHDVFVKDYINKPSGERTRKYKSIWDDKTYNNQAGTQEVKALLGGDVMSFPKSKDLLCDVCRMGMDAGDTVLDFFSGSATSAHAVMQLNREDGGTRKFIMVQLPEDCDPKSPAFKSGFRTISEIGKERIRRAGDNILGELKKEAGSLGKGKSEDAEVNPYLTNPDALDIGFKSFRIEDTKINWLKKDLRGEELDYEQTTEKDRLDFVPGFTDLDIVYELILRQANIPLTEPITPLSEAGKRTYLYGESYVICLEETVTKDLVEQLATLEPTPLKFFFRDSAFGKDIALKDETFRRLNAEIAKNADVAASYTVEFI